MPWFVFLLLAANVLVGGYLVTAREPAGKPADVRALEVNADKVKVVEPAKGTGAAAAESPGAAQARPPEQAAVGQGAPAAAEKATAPAGACIEWGPLAQAELERAQEELAALGGVRTIVRELAATPAWWVHVPPLATRADAERRAREIEAAGVQDVRVVDGERWRNAISLGIFKTEEAASAQLARLRAAQVRNVAVVQRNDLLRTASILIVEPPAALAARIAQLRSGYPGSELRAVACPA